MKDYLHLIVFSAFVSLTAAPVAAQFQGPTDTHTPAVSLPITPVAQAKSLEDDAFTAMRGFLLRQVDDDEYIFSDESDPVGTDPLNVIKVEIDDDDDFRGQTITPQTKVVVVGAVDQDDDAFNEVEVEVCYIAVDPTTQ